MAKPKSRQPDYKLSAMDKNTGVKCPNVGAGWIKDDGRISIKLNLCTVLTGNNPDLVLTLFPNDNVLKKDASGGVEDVAEIPY